MIRVGDLVRFIPSQDYGTRKSNKPVNARAIYINEAHRYVVLEYDTSVGKLRECFKIANGVDVNAMDERAMLPRQIKSKHGGTSIY